MDDVENAMKRKPFSPVRLIQGNIDQNLKWNPQYQDETVQAYLSESSMPRPPRRALVIWPETAAPFYFQDSSHLRRRILDFVRESGVWLILGSPSYQAEGRRMDFGNSAFLVNPEGVPVDRYDKVHLVPYGEYVPLRRFFPFIGRLAVGIGDFRAGPAFKPVTLDGHGIGILICYEGIFPEAAGAYKRSGAELLVNITNDAWFGPTSAPLQHLSMSLFRAVENRVYLCRAANTGISALISPTGEILDRTPLFVRTHLSGQVRYLGIPTFYSTYGDVFAYSCGALLCAILIIKKARRRK
jgi:apolipoprotein N-acyltransferase